MVFYCKHEKGVEFHKNDATKKKKNQIQNRHHELGGWQSKVDLLFVLAINVVKVLRPMNKMM